MLKIQLVGALCETYHREKRSTDLESDFIAPRRCWHDDFAIIQPVELQTVVPRKVDPRFTVTQKVWQQEQLVFLFLSG